MPSKGTKKIMGIEIPDDATQPGIPMYQLAPTDVAIPNEFKIGNQLLNKATLIAQRDKDVLLTINGIEDKAGYDVAIKKRRDYRTVRTTLETMRKEMSAPHQAYVKKLKEATDDIGAAAYVGEEYFDQLITAVDNEKERIRQEKEAEKQRVIQGRVQQLISLGAIFNGNEYVFPYDESMNVSALYVKETSDENWSDDIKVVIEAFTAEQGRIEAERQQAEQEALVAQQQKEEAEALIQQQAEANRLKTESLRKKELKMLGAVLQDDDTYLIPDKPGIHLAPISSLVDFDDDAWEQLVSDIEKYVDPETAPHVVGADPISEVQPDILGKNTDIDEVVTFDVVDENSFYSPEVDKIIVIQPFLNFTLADNHFDIYISLKRTIRVFPEQFRDIALSGCEIDKHGRYQGIHWAIIKT